MTGTDQALVAELISDVLRGHAQGTAATAAGTRADAVLWRQLEQLGLTLAAVPEHLGGSGGSVEDELTILRVAGTHGLSLPQLETSLAGWLLAAADLPAEPGPMTIAPAGFADRITLTVQGATGTLAGVSTTTAFVPDAERLVVSCRNHAGDAFVAAVPTDAVSAEQTMNFAGEPRFAVRFDAVLAAPVPVPDRAGPEQLLRRAALGRCVMTVGALEAIRDLTVRHVGDRQQFGQPLRKFQAVEHQLAVTIRECALAAAVTDAATAALLASGELPLAEVAAAKVVCGRAATIVSAIAHQLHGAIGITTEHPLAWLTRHVLSWRDDYGTERAWSTAFGRELCRTDPWPRLSATGHIGRPERLEHVDDRHPRVGEHDG